MLNAFSSEILRIIKLFLGLFLFALGIIMTLQANLGFPPWDVFHQGVALNLGLTLGRASILTAFVIVAIAVFMKERLGFGTLCNMIFIGFFMDIILSGEWIPLMGGFVSGVGMMVSGLFVIGFGSFLYIGAGYGAGPRDSLMVVLTKRTGKSVGLCRGCMEGAALLVGWLLGGHAGIGTVISALGIGFAVQIVFSILRFDVKAVHQESFYETCMRLLTLLHYSRLSTKRKG